MFPTAGRFSARDSYRTKTVQVFSTRASYCSGLDVTYCRRLVERDIPCFLQSFINGMTPVFVAFQPFIPRFALSCPLRFPRMQGHLVNLLFFLKARPFRCRHALQHCAISNRSAVLLVWWKIHITHDLGGTPHRKSTRYGIGKSTNIDRLFRQKVMFRSSWAHDGGWMLVFSQASSLTYTASSCLAVAANQVMRARLLSKSVESASVFI